MKETKKIEIMTKLKVVFNNDPTGMSKDITEEIKIPSNTCLYCNCEKESSLYKEIYTALLLKRPDLNLQFGRFYLLKVYTC
jgi:hypothetical protein